MPYISQVYDNTATNNRQDLPVNIRGILQDTRAGHICLVLSHQRKHATLYCSLDNTIQSILASHPHIEFLEYKTIQEVYSLTYNTERKQYEGKRIVPQEEFHKTLSELLEGKDRKFFFEFI
jgi:hypothetical protein